MSYIVVYQRADGSSGVEECADLDLAIVSAERLRNVDSVERPRIYKTEEVTYDFKPYYRVEVTLPDAEASNAASSADANANSDADAASSEDDEIVDEVNTDDNAPSIAGDATITTEPPVVESPPAPPAPTSTQGLDVPETEPASVKKGLFGAEPNGDSSDFSGSPAEETADAVPPRRGLFGR